MRRSPVQARSGPLCSQVSQGARTLKVSLAGLGIALPLAACLAGCDANSARVQRSMPTAMVPGVDVVSPGAEPRIAPRYETSKRVWQWRSVLSAELTSPTAYAQMRTFVHLFDGPRADDFVELFATTREPVIRDRPHNEAATDRSAGGYFSLGFLALTSRGQILQRSRETISELVEGRPISRAETATAAVIPDALAATVVRFPKVPVGRGASWTVRAYGDSGEPWSSHITLASADDEHIDLAVRHTIDGPNARVIDGSLRLGRAVPVAVTARLTVSAPDGSVRAYLRLEQTLAAVLPGPAWPQPFGAVHRHHPRCVTRIGEPGIQCLSDGVCCNPCLPGMATEAGMYCNRICDTAADCKAGGICEGRVCSYDTEPDCAFPKGCDLPNGDPGRRCRADEPCMSFCGPGMRLLYGTHCVRPCRDDSDCPGHHCQTDEAPFPFCAGLCPSTGCPYLYD